MRKKITFFWSTFLNPHLTKNPVGLTLRLENYLSVVAGDFNIHYELSDDPAARRITDITSSFHCIPHCRQYRRMLKEVPLISCLRRPGRWSTTSRSTRRVPSLSTGVCRSMHNRPLWCSGSFGNGKHSTVTLSVVCCWRQSCATSQNDDFCRRLLQALRARFVPAGRRLCSDYKSQSSTTMACGCAVDGHWVFPPVSPVSEAGEDLPPNSDVTRSPCMGPTWAETRECTVQ